MKKIFCSLTVFILFFSLPASGNEAFEVEIVQDDGWTRLGSSRLLTLSIGEKVVIEKFWKQKKYVNGEIGIAACVEEFTVLEKLNARFNGRKSDKIYIFKKSGSSSYIIWIFNATTDGKKSATCEIENISAKEMLLRDVQVLSWYEWDKNAWIKHFRLDGYKRIK